MLKGDLIRETTSSKQLHWVVNIKTTIEHANQPELRVANILYSLCLPPDQQMEPQNVVYNLIFPHNVT